MANEYYRAADDECILIVKKRLAFRESGGLERGVSFFHIYDFREKTLSAIDESIVRSCVPFSQLDNHVLEMMRQKLIELGGKPDPLRGEAKAALSVSAKFPRP